jgi:single-strand DNA-binding protein
MNVVILKGNLARDPEVRSTGGGISVCNGSIALNRRVKKGEQWTDEVTFVDFTVWGTRGDAFAKHHHKGSAALLHGRLQADSWEDKNTGEKRWKLKVVVEDWEFCGGKQEKSGGGEGIGGVGGPSSYGSNDSDDGDTPF